MVETFFERSFAINRLRQGPLAGHIDLLAARLKTDGYSRVHSRIQLRLIGESRFRQAGTDTLPKHVAFKGSRSSDNTRMEVSSLWTTSAWRLGV